MITALTIILLAAFIIVLGYYLWGLRGDTESVRVLVKEAIWFTLIVLATLVVDRLFTKGQ